jgi:hypothetical protein
MLGFSLAVFLLVALSVLLLAALSMYRSLMISRALSLRPLIPRFQNLPTLLAVHRVDKFSETAPTMRVILHLFLRALAM